MTSHAVHSDIDVRIDGDQITGYAGVGPSQPSQPEPFPGWLGFVGALDRPMGDAISTEGPVPGSAAAMDSVGGQAGAGRGSGQ